MGKTLRRKSRPSPRAEILEARQLFSADILGAAVDPGTPDDDLHFDSLEQQSVLDGATRRASDNLALSVSSGDADDAAQQETDELTPEADTSFAQTSDARHELIIVDSDVQNYEQLLSDVQTSPADDTRVEIFVLDRQSSGIAQISELLGRYRGLGAIHLVSHGAEGEIRLLGETIDAETLHRNEDLVRSWGEALGENGDILIYGCDLASSANGEQFVDTLARLTGSDVAASDDPTGNPNLGGDWQLEYRIGTIEESSTTVSNLLSTSISSVLGETIIHSYEPSFAAIPDASYEIKTDQPWGQSVSFNSGTGTYEVDKIEVVLSKANDAPSQTITVTLRESFNGTILGSSTLSSDSLTTSEAWYQFDMGGLVLNDTTTYVIQVETDGTGKTYFGVGDPGSYGGGDLLNKDGVAQPGKDAAFRFVDFEETITTFTVTNTNDSGSGSLRQAITDANANPGTDAIDFSILGTGPHTINLASQLPLFYQPVIVDGSTQSGYTGTPLIILNGGGTIADGLELFSGSDGSTIRGLSFQNFTDNGIDIGGSDSNTIVGNWFGLSADGTSAAGNNIGLNLYDANSNTIGGTSSADANVFAGNDFGMLINGASTGNTLQGNIVGLDPTGTGAIGNAFFGILIVDSDSNIVGGSAAGAANLIAGNDGGGLSLQNADSTIVQGNFIGTDASATLDLGNTWFGIDISGSSTGNRIGGTGANEGNIIAHTASTGVGVTDTASNNAILGNLIYDNDGLGIDLGYDWITDNDTNDADSGPNALQNFPVLFTAVPETNEITITGSFNSQSSTSYRIEFFSSPSGSEHFSGHGEGSTYLGFTDVTTDGSGNASISLTLTGVDVAVGERITATATHKPTAVTYAETSEFALNVIAGHAPVNTVPGLQSEDEDTELAIGGISVSDTDSDIASTALSVSNGTLRVSLAGGATIGAGVNGGSTLTLSGNAAQINAALATLTYQGLMNFNGGDTLSVTTTDVHGLSDVDTVSITVNPVDDAPSFAVGDGIATDFASNVSDAANDLIVLDNGKMIVIGSANNGSGSEIALSRYHPDGTLDTGFGTGGRVTTSISSSDFGRAVALQPDGSILVAGSANDGTGRSFIVRYTADGALDTGFDGDGIVILDISPTSSDLFEDLVVQADGKIVAVGYAYSGANNVATVVRLNSDGSLDTSFNGTGILSLDFGTGDDTLNAVTLQADGKIVVAGQANSSSSGNIAVARLNTDGSYDTTFNGTGLFTLDVQGNEDLASAVAIDTDGKIVVAGSASTTDIQSFAMRLNTDGTLDTSFNTTGYQTIAAGSPFEGIEDLALQDDGKILLAGNAYAGAGLNDVSVIRLNTDGSLDTSFAGDGTFRQAIGTTTDQATAIALDSQGGILVTGRTDATQSGIFLMRIDASGALDTTNNFAPVNSLDGNPTFVEDGSAVVLDADVAIFDAELSAANDFGGTSLTLVRNGGANTEDVFGTTGNLVFNAGTLELSATAIGSYTNSGGQLVLNFGAGTTNAQVNAAMQSIAYSNSSDDPPASVQIDWSFNDGNTGNAQGSGGALTAIGSTIVTITPTNDTPTVANAIPDQAAAKDSAFNFQFASNTFSDPDSGDSLTYSATLDDDSALPAWLNFDSTTRTFSGTPTNSDVGTISVKVTASDGNGGTAADTFDLVVVSVTGPIAANDDSVSTNEDTPLIISPLANDQGSTTLIDFTQPTNGNLVDNGDGTLTYTPHANFSGTDSFDYVVADSNASLTHYWSLDGSAYDSVGTLNGTLNGTTTVAGTVGNGLSFNESSDFVQIPDVTYGSAFTIAFDFKLDSNTGSLFQYIYSHGDINTTNSVNIFVNESSHGTDPDVMRTVIRDSDDTVDNFALQFDISAIVGDGLWHTYTATVGPDGIEVFLDGVSQATDATRGTGGVNPTGNLYLGVRQDFDADRYFGGSLDSLRIYDSVMTTAQASAIANTSIGTVTISVESANDAPTFAIGDGIAMPDIVALSDGAVDVVVQNDGKYIVLTSANRADSGQDLDFVLTRYNADGTLDTDFGTNGIVITAINTNNEAPKTVALQDDGKILVAGGYVPEGEGTVDSIVMRYNSDGTLDTTFSGDGIMEIDFSPTSTDLINDMVVQDDGKIVVVGYGSFSSVNQITVARLNSDGSLDTSFDGDGIRLFSVSGNGAVGNDVKLLSDGRILIAGYARDAGLHNDVVVISLNTDGSLDTGFDTDGILLVDLGAEDSGTAMAVDENDTIFVAGTTTLSGSGDSFIIKLDSSGNLITDFGTNGVVIHPIGSPFENVNDMVLQADGKIVIVGDAYNGSNTDVSVIRLNTDGSLDTSFDGDGKIRDDLSGATDSGKAVALDRNGDIIVVGNAAIGGVGETFVARIDINGRYDQTFDPVNTLDGNPTFVEDGPAVILDADTQIYDADLSGADNFGGATLTLTRTGGANAEDVFSETGLLDPLSQGGDLIYDSTIVGTVTTNSGGTLLLTFNASATNARVNGVMQSIAYENTSDTPPSSVDIQWTFDDGNSGAQGSGGAQQAVGSTTVDITAVNDAPVFSDLDANPTHVEAGAAVVIDADVSISDAELDVLNGGNGNYAGTSLTIVRNGGADAEDVLSFNDGNGITLIGNSLIKNGLSIGFLDTFTTAGELVVYFTDASGEIPTSSDVDNILRQITYENSSDTPPASVQLDWTFDDGNSGDQGTGGAQQAFGSTTVNITSTNDAPILDLDADDSSGATGANHQASFTEGDAPVAVIGNDVSISDADDTTLTEASVSGAFNGFVDVGDEVITVGGVEIVIGSANSDQVTVGGTTFQFDSDGGDLQMAVFSGTGAIADFEALLATMTYENRSESPTEGVRSFSLFVSDPSMADSNIATTTISVTAVNDPPTVANAIPDQAATEDSAFNFQFASNTFDDVDVGDTLTYSATLDDDSALPTWLSFDGATRTFSGTPTNDDVGTISVKVTADDGNGGTVSDTFDIVVSNTNDFPTVANPIADQAATEDSAFNFQFASNTFEDQDASDTLTYSATLDDDSALPTWLSFDGATRTFSGTPTNADVGTISVKVTADDGNGGTVSDTFDIVVANSNDFPAVTNAIPDQAATEDSAFSFQFASNTFSDPDVGDTLSYSATLADDSALPAWLSFDSATRTFSGTPTNDDVGTISVKVTADDGNGGTVTDTFDIVVANSNDFPVVANAIPDQTATEDSAFSFQFASNTFSDPDVGDTLSYSATLDDDSALPAWLSFDSATRTFSGTPTNDDVGTISVKVTADDGNGGTVSDTFDIAVSNSNDFPVVANAIPDQSATEDSAFSFQFASDTFSDPDVGDTLSYSATLNDDSALPAWLSFDSATRTFSGTPTNDDVGTISVKVTADDGNGGTVSDTFDIAVSNSNDFPVVANAIPDQSATEDSAFSFQFASDTFSDPDVGDTLSYSATLNDDSALPAWLSFDSATRTFSGTPTNDDVGTISVKVTADDGNGGTVSDTFDIAVSNTNDAPIVANTIPDQSATEDSAFTFQFASNSFTDPDVGDSLSYSASLVDDSALPAWLSFDSATRTFSGTPTNDDVGTISVKVTADDGNGGTVTDTFDIVVSNTNDDPVVANAIPDQAATEDSAFSFQFASNTFSDPDVGDTLSYSATLADDSALPAWLSFDSATRTFSGTPTNDDVGTISVKVTADDGNGGTVTDTFDIVVSNTNDDPVVANAIPDQAATEDSAFSFQFASNTFSDPDLGDTLSYSATLADDSALPAWLSFDSATRTFSGTPTNDDVGTISVKVTADDGNGGTVSDIFDIVISNSNDFPIVANAIPDQAATEDSAFSFQFASNTFSDPDVGDTLSYSATLSDDSALPAWLNFDSATRTFSGTPTNDDVGTISVKVTADDGNGGTVSDTFDIVVSNTNDAPVVANAIADQSATEDNAFSFQFAANTFSDPDVGDTLSYSATLGDDSALPAWLSFDSATRTFSGTSTNTDVGTISIKVTANDGNGGTVSDTFDIVVSNANDAPVVANAIPDQAATEDSAFNFQFANDTFSDPDVGDTLSYSATLSDDSALPAWLSFDSATRTFSGTPTNDDVGTISVKVTADDGSGGTVSDTFDIVVSNTNDAPTVANAIPNQAATEDSAFSFQFASNTFSDPDVGDTLSYSATLDDDSALPVWLSFDAATRTFSGTPSNDDVGTISVKVTADDGNGGAVSDTFDIVVSNTNDAPVVANAIPDQGASEDSALSFQFASNTFSDPDVGDSLSYSATLDDDSALPAWLSFDGATRTFSGTPSNADVGTISVKVTANDGNGGTVSDTFDIVVANTNDAPIVANAIPAQAATEDVAFTFQFASNSFTDPDVGDSLSYSATLADDSALPAWLSFDAATRTFSGTPGNSDIGTISVKVTADDGNGGTVFDTFDIVVANANDAPVVANAIPDQAATEDSPFSFQFASNTFSDPDVGDTLSYSASLSDDSALPAWLSFDSATRTFSGTPANADVGTISVKVTADDGNGGTISDSFDIVVANTNDAPVVANPIADQAATQDSAFSFQFAANTFSDPDVGDTLSYSATQADNSALPAWLSFDAATRTFSGTPTNADVGTISVKVNADDGSGITASDTFDIVVANANDGPVVANAIPDQAATEDSAFNFQFASDTFNDPDAGDTLNYSATLTDDSALPAWLSFDAATRTFSGTPTNDDVGTVTVKVTADDGNGGTISDTFDIVVANSNDAPVVANTIPDQAATEVSAFTFQFASNTFSDVDVGDTLSYSATQADDSALPGWLSFDAATRTFSGTPSNADVGTLSVKVTADDGNGGMVSDTFDIVVANTNDVPTVANAIPDQGATEDSAFNFQFASNTFSDPDVGDTLSYSATLDDDSALPAWLSFDAATRTFSGTPTNSDVGTISVKVTTNDGNGGTVSDTFDIIVANTNDAPTVANAIADQAATEDSAFNFQFASNTFSDVDAGDTLSYSATLADDSALPAWLSFDAATRTFSGTPGNADVGTISVKVTADDGNGGTVFDTFDIVVANTNNAPTVANAIGDQAATEDAAFSFQFASNTFSDPDVGDTLTYSATLSDNSALPAWLGFDAATRTFSGTPTNADVGTISIKVTADDGNGGTVSDTFDIVVANTNDAPIVANAIADQAATEGNAFSFQFASNTFSDPDVGDTLTYSATLSDDSALPAWLSFDAATRTFSGTPGNADVGTISVKVTANDGNSGTAFDSFNIVVANTNNAPIVANAIADQAATEDSAFNFQFTNDTFTDADVGDTLTYSATLSDDSALPAWLSFDAATRTFSGTPSNSDVGTISVKVTANDGSGGAVSDTFDVVVANTNDAPTVASPIPDQAATEDVAFSYQFAAGTFADVDVGDTLSYSATLADDSALPAWLSFDSATRTFSGTPTASDVGTISVKVTANDGNGGTVSDTFNLVVGAASNNPPTVANPIANQAATEDSAFNFQFASNTFNDPDVGDTLSYTATLSDDSALPTWLSFDSATRTFSGTPANDDVGTISVKVTANDGSGGAVSDTFDIVVANTNDAPTVASPIPDQAATEDVAFSYPFTAGTFADVDVGDTLSYSATLADDSALPAWLSFDSATRTFSGTPTASDVGTISVKVTANDGNGGTVSDTFDLVVGAASNNPPTVANPIADQAATEDSAFNFQFASNTFSDPDVGDTLTYSATLNDDSAIPAWLSFDSATRTFSGTPTNSDVGTISVKVTANDGNGGTVSDTFTIVVVNSNDAPTIANAIAHQTAIEDTPFTFQFAANTFDDVDAGDTLSYTASGLPAWLNFDPATRTFNGTPQNGDVGTINITVTASDGHGGAVSNRFGIVVTNTNDAPEGSVFIDNPTPEEGDTLTAGNTLTDADGLNGPIGYQWYRDGVQIDGATGTSYTTTAQDVGTVISVVVSYTDDRGTDESVGSSTEAVREAGNEAPTGTVTISGLAVEDEILTAADTLDDPDGVGTVSYQWQRDGADVSGATGTRYALTDDDVGTIITVVARYTDERGHQESVASDPVGPIANVNDPATGDWVITGSATEGQIIFAERRLVADADGLGPFQYQWMRDGSPIAGATGTAYQLSGNDVGAYVYLQVSFVDGHGTNETMTSAGIVPQPLLTPELIDLLDSATQSAVNEPSTSTAGSSPPPGVERLTTAFAGTSTTDGTLQEKEPDEEQTELPDTAEELTQTSQTSPTEAEPPLYALSDDVFAIAPVSPLSAESISSVLATTTTITTDDLRQDLPTYELPTPQFLDVQNLDLNPVTLASYNLATNDRTGDNRTLDRSIEEMAFQMQSSADAHELETRLRSEAVIGLAVSLTAGFVSWVLRAGSLLASFVAVLPVWRHFDPLPILSNFKSDAKKKTGAGEENPDNAEVENIFEQDGRR